MVNEMSIKRRHAIGGEMLETRRVYAVVSFAANVIRDRSEAVNVVAAADVDGDGIGDVFESSGNSTLAWFDTQGTRHAMPDSHGTASSLVPADIDQDGDVDLVYVTGAATPTVAEVSWQENLGNGRFSVPHVVANRLYRFC